MPPKTDLFEKIRILKILEVNQFNYTKTARETGVSTPTLRKWVKQDGANVFKGTTEIVKEVSEDIDTQLLERKKNFLLVSFELKELIAKQMKFVIPRTKNLDMLSRALKVVAELDKDQVPPGDDDPEGENTASFIETITRQLKIKLHGTKDNIPAGN